MRFFRKKSPTKVEYCITRTIAKWFYWNIFNQYLNRSELIKILLSYLSLNDYTPKDRFIIIFLLTQLRA